MSRIEKQTRSIAASSIILATGMNNKNKREGDLVGLEHGCLKNGGDAVEHTTPA